MRLGDGARGHRLIVSLCWLRGHLCRVPGGGVSVCSQGLCQSRKHRSVVWKLVHQSSWTCESCVWPLTLARQSLRSLLPVCFLVLEDSLFSTHLLLQEFFLVCIVLSFDPEKIIVVHVESWYWRGLAPPVQIPPVTRVLLSM